MTAHAIQRALVIGGGIGGLCAAIGLRQASIDAIVYEKAEAIGQVGAGLIIWANAIRALRTLGLAEAVIRAGSVVKRSELRTAAGRTLTRSSPEELERLYGEPTVAIHRADLHAILLAALPADAVRLGAVCVGFTQDAQGATARFAHGQTDRADLLIGADGIHSVVRRLLFPDVPLRYSGYAAWRGVVATRDEVALGITSESWGRGSRFGIVRVDADRVYWFATANAPAGQAQSIAERKRFLSRRFAGWHHPVELLIEATPAEAILHNDIHDLKPLACWRQGRVTLLGDAAHPTTPNMGQGACMAIESAVVLGRCLAQEQELDAALSRYEALRRPRTAWVTNQSWQIGRIGQLENRLACAVRNVAMSLVPPAVMLKQIEQAVSYNIPL